MNLTRPEPLVGFEGTEAVSGARVPSELHFTNGTARIMSPRTRGFTLLEVLIAVMVGFAWYSSQLAVLIGGVAYALSGAVLWLARTMFPDQVSKLSKRDRKILFGS